MTRDWIRHPMVVGGAVVAAVLALMQGGVPGVPHSLDSTRLFQVLALTACLLLLREVRTPAHWGWVWGGLLGIGVVSSFLGAHPGLSLKEVFLWTALLLAAPRLAGLRRGALVALGVALLVLQVAWTLDFFFFWAQPHVMGEAYEPEAFTFLAAFSIFSHPRFLNQFQSWMLPVAALLCLRLNGPTGLRALCWGLLVVSWAQLWLSLGRGTLVGMVAGGLVVAVFLGREGRRFALLQVVLAAAGAALHALFFRLLQRADAGFETVLDRPATTTGRTPAWERAWEMFLEAPLLGRGPQSFTWEGFRFAHPHNTPLQLLAEWGAVGTLFIVAMIGIGGLAVLRLRRSGRFRLARRWWLVALVYSTVAAATHSLVSAVAIMPLSQLAGMVVLALWFRVTGQARGRAMRAPAVLICVALVALALAGLLFPEAELPFLGPTSLDLDSLATGTFRRPRFWADGL